MSDNVVGDQQEAKPNAILYDPVFPVLTASVLLEFDLDTMRSEIYKIASDKKNAPGGFISEQKDVDTLSQGTELQGAVYQVCLNFLRELKLEFNTEKCSMRCAINVLRKDGYLPIQQMQHSQVTGMFFVSRPTGTSNLMLHNPTTPLRSHEHLPMRPQDLTAFTAPSISIEPKENTLYVWPSWLKHELSSMDIGGPLIAISFAIDFLPTGV